MLFTLLTWSYILITAFICGFFILVRVFKAGFLSVRFGPCIICGLILLTAYSEYVSLFFGVGLSANIILLIVCFLFVCIDRRKYRDFLLQIRERTDRHKTAELIKYLVYLAIILVSAYFTAAGTFTYDTGTYHAQSIHWIESYGVVRGLAYMQTRLGFNSSYFALCALYSFSFLGQSMHTLSGFLAAFAMTYSAGSFICRLEDTDGKIGIRVSDFARIAPFAYFVIIAFEVISPSTDYGVIWMILWFALRWTECIEDDTDTDKVTRLALLSVFTVFLVSVKLSVGVLAIVTLQPLYSLLKEKRYTQIAGYVLAGVALILPYFIRNYLITGWLIYPFPAVDLFNPDWKVPVDGVRYEADEIVVWARYTKDAALIDQGIGEWFPVWWQEQGQANRFLSWSAFAGCLVMTVRIIVSMAAFISHKAESLRTGEQASHTFFGTVLLISFAFFMLSAPSNRFGYGYILLVPLYAAGDMCVNLLPAIFKKKSISLVLSLILIAMTLTGLVRGLRMFAYDDLMYARKEGVSGYTVFQKDYPAARYGTKEWEGMTISYPLIEGEQIWYHAFPAILYEGNLEGMERRGQSVRDGFRLK